MTIDVASKVISIIAKQLRIPEGDIKLESEIMQDLKADSLDIVEILLAVEETYGINVPDSMAPELKTVKQLCKFIEEHK